MLEGAMGALTVGDRGCSTDVGPVIDDEAENRSTNTVRHLLPKAS
jgi:delta 1-pyrroline-5-carboxylate dehydrogenase